MSKKKNILFVLADQLRTDFCGCYGADWLSTPCMDQLASEGVKYTKAISPSPACVPARASLFTGKSALANRVTDNRKWLRPDHEEMGIYTWPQQLAEKGYHTVAIGKMHFYPWDISEGFQHRVIAEDKRHVEIQDDYTIYLKKHGYNRYHGSVSEGYYEHKGAIISVIPEEHQIDRYVCNETCDYLDCIDEDQPFAMMVGFPGPHCPYDPTQEMMDKIAPDAAVPPAVAITEASSKFLAQNHRDNAFPWNGVDITTFTEEQKVKVRRHYSALVQGIDEYLNIIIQKLKDKGIYEDTIIIFSSDHGDYLGDFGMAGKGHFYESSCRIPMIIRYPGQEPMVIEHAVSLTDIYNTILTFGGIEVADTDDSTVLAPFGAQETRGYVFGCNEMGWMLRDDQYQYSVYFNGLRELYDCVNDPGQQVNLLSDSAYNNLAECMRTELERRVFIAVNDGNSDTIAKPNNMNRKYGQDPFNHEGWKRPYPYNSLK